MNCEIYWTGADVLRFVAGAVVGLVIMWGWLLVWGNSR